MEIRYDPDKHADRRRIMVYELSADRLLDLLRPGPHCYIIVGTVIPEDARLIGAQFDIIRNCWELRVFSETFAPVPEYRTPPDMPVIVAEIVSHQTQEMTDG